MVARVAWAPLAVLVLHTVAARLFGHEPYVDPVMHFSGGVAAAYFFRHVCEGSQPAVGRLASTWADLLAFGLTCAVALFWEFGEFFSDQFLGTNVQVSVANTMRDLMLGVLGAIMFLVPGVFRRAGRSPGD